MLPPELHYPDYFNSMTNQSEVISAEKKTPSGTQALSTEI